MKVTKEVLRQQAAKFAAANLDDFIWQLNEEDYDTSDDDAILDMLCEEKSPCQKS